ncbi:hypothetical protein GVN16_21805 [Emticicia sp. CRIBPO]|uniref:hypothetical protein n=1 Tax=Emticicia sp. CRIBPO TaxID=2683258 RepID=UPI0014124E13|nr:hypothetical protein [Emticicia sp. CRIBPO]NBA88424.1 hypothetical protein [Emticicia sp. CRIBPO]
MKKSFKIILTALNTIILIIAAWWFFDDMAPEPLIIVLGQFTTLLVLFFEKEVSNIFTIDVTNSKIRIRSKSGDSIYTKRIKDSDIDIE